jgi:hypothetical protein
LPFSHEGYYKPCAIAVGAGQPPEIFIGLNTGGVFEGMTDASCILRDNPGVEVLTMLIVPIGGGFWALAGTEGGLFTALKGDDWHVVEHEALTGVPIYASAMISDAESLRVFIGTDRGVFWSDDRGETWEVWWVQRLP